jgi:hypothetical protein
MKITRTRGQLLAAGAIALGATFAFALPAGAAVSSQSPPTAVLKLANQANIDANGAVVFVPLRFTCRPGSQAYVSAEITENVGGFIASGSGSTRNELNCSGKAQSVTLAVTPTQRAFAKGVAFGEAYLQVCNSNGCQTVADQRNVQIVK